MNIEDDTWQPFWECSTDAEWPAVKLILKGYSPEEAARQLELKTKEVRTIVRRVWGRHANSS
jgi:ATP/maltotriose-dependent transcriptional regulator MalT